jgi:cation diffusion facilitator family transporter
LPRPDGREFDVARSGKVCPVNRRSRHEATRRTVIIAGAANILVGLVKLVAGILSGSSAMLAEAAHSAADTLDQVFLLTSLRQSERPASRAHPFGHGQERYFWSLLAAFGIFIAGAGFSVFEGVLALGRAGGGQDPLVGYVVLAVAFAAEGTSLGRAYWQTRAEARRRGLGLLDHVRSSPDTTVKAALFEDTAAVAGLGLAAAGLALRQLTGSPVWDGAASMAIGGLLVAVAIKLGADSRDLLIGRAAGAREQELIRAEIRTTRGVDRLLGLQTMYLGPEHLIVAARVAFSDEISADRAEDLADDIDRRLAERLPLIPHVFIDPTQAPAGPGTGTAVNRRLAALPAPRLAPPETGVAAQDEHCDVVAGRRAADHCCHQGGAGGVRRAGGQVLAELVKAVLKWLAGALDQAVGVEAHQGAGWDLNGSGPAGNGGIDADHQVRSHIG